jgi:hypothetical protein
MVSDSWPPHPSSSDPRESRQRFGAMFAELWQDWFETMSDVAYQTHRACEFLAKNGAPPNEQFGPFYSGPSGSPYESSDDPIDMDKLKECLQPLDPMQAARVIYAVQTMQAMEALLKRRRSRANESKGTDW